MIISGHSVCSFLLTKSINITSYNNEVNADYSSRGRPKFINLTSKNFPQNSVQNIKQSGNKDTKGNRK